MSKPSETPTQTAPAAEKGMRVPQALLFQIVDALRAADKDSRRNDRVLHDATRDMVSDAAIAWSDWRDAKLRGGR